LRILVDWSSVEVFGDRGETIITDQIFPKPTSDGAQAFADGGSATIDSLDIWPLRSSWTNAGGNY
jgi:fructan beta-fructosidase